MSLQIINVRASASSPLFEAPNPNDIAGIQFRYNLLDPANYTLDGTGTLIESLNDVSGQSAGQAIKKTDADRPSFEAAGRLGKPCIFFDGTKAPLIAPSVVGSSYTKVCIFNSRGLAVGNGNRHYFGGSTSHLMGINPLSTSNWQFNDTFKSVSYNSMSPNNNESDIIVFILTHEANDSRMYVGPTMFDQDTGQAANSDATAYLGGFNNSASNSAKGECYEWMLFNSPLNAANIQKIVDYAQVTYSRDKVYDFIAAGIGQSNNVGTASGASPTHTGSTDEFNSASYIIRRLNDRVGKERAKNGSNREANASSMWPRVANQLQTNQSKNMLFAQLAVGSSAAGPKGDVLHWGSSGSIEDIRANALKVIQDLKNYFNKNLDWILDIQGEKDRPVIDGSTYTQSEYQSYKQDLYNAIWAISPTTKILTMKIAYQRDASDIALHVSGTDAVNNAYDGLASNNPNKVYVIHDASGYTKTNGNIEADGIHWTIQGLNTAADALESWLASNF